MEQPPVIPSPASSGDNGTAALPGSMRIDKSDVRFDALGSLDELGAALGSVRVAVSSSPLNTVLEIIQRDLLTIAGEVATGRPHLAPDALAKLERESIRADHAAPPTNGFDLPGKNEASVRAHVARTICRRAERDAVRTRKAHPEQITSIALAYLNRLSHFLFAVARSL